MPISEKDLEKAAEIVRHVMRGSTEIKFMAELTDFFQQIP